MNTFGRIFRVQIFGESHGKLVGVLIDGCPAGLAIGESDFETDLARRRSGAKGTTPRAETDLPRIMSGVFNGFTTGAPLLINFENQDTHSSDYDALRETPRPGHADFVANQKFGGFEDYRGGGHFSGRLTTGLVAAGVVAKRVLPKLSIKAAIIEAGGKKNVEKAIDEALAANDSIGGIIECRVTGIPIGLGEPFFDSVESVISHLVFSIPATKGIEFGSGFPAARMRGSEHNDALVSPDGRTASNNAAGINGGITNGNELIFRVAIKPTSSTKQKQHTLNIKTGEMVDLVIQGRHDTCIALRVPPILEAVTAIALADLMMLEQKLPRVMTSNE